MASTRHSYEYFGKELSVGDFNQDGVADLVVGVIREPTGPTRAGVVHFIWGGRADGLEPTLSPWQIYHQGSFSGPGFGAFENEHGDRFGAVLP